MMATSLVINEGSTLGQRCTFRDAAGQLFVPISVEWFLCRSDDSVVRHAEVEPASVVTIVLSGADHDCGPDRTMQMRKLVVKYTYNSDLGSGLDDSVSTEYWVKPIPGGYQP